MSRHLLIEVEIVIAAPAVSFGTEAGELTEAGVVVWARQGDGRSEVSHAILISKFVSKTPTEPLQSLPTTDKLAGVCWVEAWAKW